MLQMLKQVAQEGSINVLTVYLGHIKKDEDRKILAHADVMFWSDMEPSIRAVLEHHLYQAIEGAVGEVNFPCMYTGEVLSVAKVASEHFDQTQNRPTVEVLEAVAGPRAGAHNVFIELGNTLAYKIMAAGAIKNHLVALLHFQIVPSLGAAPLPFSFASIVDLDDHEESLFDESKGTFVTQMLNNVVKKGSISRAVFFPCLDDDGRELADMLIYAGSGAGAWFKALEATRRFSPRREGQALLRMITEQTSGSEVPHYLFRTMGTELVAEVGEGLHAESVAISLEKALGHGIDRLGFFARWELAFGDLGYKPSYDSLFATDAVDKPTKLKMQAGEIDVTITPAHLENFRQVTIGDQTFIVFAVPERAKVVVGKDLDLKIIPVTPNDLKDWLFQRALTNR
jgi:hypothetical protein